MSLGVRPVFVNGSNLEVELGQHKRRTSDACGSVMARFSSCSGQHGFFFNVAGFEVRVRELGHAFYGANVLRVRFKVKQTLPYHIRRGGNVHDDETRSLAAHLGLLLHPFASL